MTLLEAPQNTALPPAPRAGRPARVERGGATGGALVVGPRDQAEAGPVNWLAHVFLLLGIGLLTIIVIETINIATHFPAIGPFVTVSEGLRRFGYYAGIVLYSNSARTLTGFALLAGGVLIGRAARREAWDRSVRATGLVMGGVSIVYFCTCVLLILPLGSPAYALRTMLPPLWAAVPILLVTGAALMGAGFLMASRLSAQRESFKLRAGEKVGGAGRPAPDARLPGTPGAPKPGDATASSFGVERGGGAED